MHLHAKYCQIITPMNAAATFTSWWSEAGILVVSTIHWTTILLWSAIERASVQGSAHIRTSRRTGEHIQVRC